MNSSYVFVLGARQIANKQYDLFFEGQLAGVVLLPSVAPSAFSPCVVSCLEQLTVDTTGKNIFTSGFDVSQRHLRLVGMAPPPAYQSVLASMIYVNRAPSPNVQLFLLVLNDGNKINEIYIPASFQANKRRRRSIRHGLKQRRLLSAKQEEGDDIILDHGRETGDFLTPSREGDTGGHVLRATPRFSPLLAMSLVTVIGLISTLSVLAILWTRRRSSTPAPVS